MKKLNPLRPILFCLMLAIGSLSAQNVGINDDNSNPEASAMLDVKSTSKGMLIPRMTTVQRTGISNAAVGLLVFDAETESFWFKTSNGWTELVNNPVKTICDADGDTKIQTEESPNENILRFDVGGAERWTMRDDRLEPQNAGHSVFVGKDAGYTGSNNTYLGYQAGQNATGSNNIFIGKDAGSNETGSNRLFIGPLLYGETDNGLLRVNGTLNINNAYSLPTADGSANQVLQTNGSGSVGWANQTASGTTLPIGTILPYAGHIVDDGSLITIDGGFLLCNGATISSAESSPQYALAMVIEQFWGDADGQINSVNLPDLRGMFLRGVNGERLDGKHDPGDVYPGDNRGTMKSGGSSGNHVGSYQGDVFGSHNHGGGDHSHSYVGHNSSFSMNDQSGTGQHPLDNTKTRSTASSGQIIIGEGGTETRPRNAYVHYIIKY